MRLPGFKLHTSIWHPNEQGSAFSSVGSWHDPGAVLRFPGVNSSIQQALDRLHPTLEALQDQMTSIWLPIQVGLVLIGALAALAATRMVRRQPGLAVLADRLP